jgi:hypothetical protein
MKTMQIRCGNEHKIFRISKVKKLDRTVINHRLICIKENECILSIMSLANIEDRSHSDDMILCEYIERNNKIYGYVLLNESGATRNSINSCFIIKDDMLVNLRRHNKIVSKLLCL